MKKYFIAVAALAFLAACNGKAAKDAPVLVEEESIAVAEAAPEASSLPELPVVKAKPAKPINMRDSLKLNPEKGAVVNWTPLIWKQKTAKIRHLLRPVNAW